MKKATKTVAIVTAALLLTAGPALAKTKGFYIGGSIGESTLDLGGIIPVEPTDTAYKLFGGYRFGLVGIEGGYVDFGDTTDDFLFLPVDTKGNGWDIFGVLNIALGPVDLFGKIGLIAWDLEVDNPVDPYSDSGTDLAYGLGIAVRLGPVAVRAEYEQFDIEPVDLVAMVSLGLTFMF